LRRVEVDPDTEFKVMSKLAQTLPKKDDPPLAGWRDQNGRMANVTERNLVRAEKQLKDASEKQAADPVWAQSFNITESEDAFDSDAFFDGNPPEGGDGASQVVNLATTANR
jgi:hypothetical protein